MAKQAHKREAVLACLREHGPMTAAEAAEYLCITPTAAASVITSTRYENPGQFFRIASYRKVTGRRAKREIVFEASAGPDAKRPVVDELADRRKRQIDYYKRNAARVNARSRARRAAAKGGQAVNPWAQLAHPDLKGYMCRIAANTTMKETA
jgi:hypothetical protein